MLTLALLLAVAAPQDSGPHAGHQAAPAAASRLSLDTPIATIAADAKGKAVLDANFPGMTSHSMYEMFKGMSLKELQPMSNGRITEAALTKAGKELAAIR